MVLVAKGYRVVPQSLAVDNSRCGGHGFRHLHLKEHRGAFTLMRSTSAEKDGGKVVFAKGKTLFVGNVDDQGAFWRSLIAACEWSRHKSVEASRIAHVAYPLTHPPILDRAIFNPASHNRTLEQP